MSRECPNVPLWVDAICINQKDNLEKGRQLLLMGQVYSNPKQVFAWLGKDDVIESWMEAVASKTVPHSSTIPQQDVNVELARVARLQNWQRLWITQEILLARDILVWCGNASVSWDSLFGRHNTILDSGFEDIHHKHDISRGMLDPRLFSLRTKRSRLHMTDGNIMHKMNASQAFHPSITSKCRDPINHVYAILSLVHHGDRFPVDYDDTCGKLFLSVVAFFNVRHLTACVVEMLRLADSRTITDMRAMMDCTNLIKLEQIRLHHFILHGHKKTRLHHFILNGHNRRECVCTRCGNTIQIQVTATLPLNILIWCLDVEYTPASASLRKD